VVGLPAHATRKREIAAGVIIIEGRGLKERAVERRKGNALIGSKSSLSYTALFRMISRK
jgi:hypothetical protein